MDHTPAAQTTCLEVRGALWPLVPEVPTPPLANPTRPTLRPPSLPYGAHEISAAARSPHRIIDLVLAEPGRLAATISARVRLPLLMGILLGSSLLCAAPYGAVLQPDRFWNVALLFLGSTLICVPSLHVFGTFLGFRTTLGQTLALATIIPSVAGLFTLGFAPILWFLRATMSGEAADTALRGVSTMLLGAALLGGITQLVRALAARSDLRLPGAYWALLACWVGLLLFIVVRMAAVLGMLA